MSNGNQGGGNKPPSRPPAPRLNDVRPSEHRTGPPTRSGRTAHTGGQPPRQGPPVQHYPPRYANPQGHGAARQGQRSALASVLLYGAAGLAVLFVAAAALLFVAPPTDLIRREAIDAVKRQTGRDLAIRGPARLTFYPSLGVSLDDVSLSPPPGMDGPPMATIARLDVAVDLMSLVSRRIEVKKLVLTRPRFELRIDGAGRKSWEFAAARTGAAHLRLAAVLNRDGVSSMSDAAGIVVADARVFAAAAASPGKSLSLEELRLENIRVVDGELSFSDDRSRASWRVASIDAEFASAGMRNPLTAKGDLDWQGETVNFDGSVSTVASLLKEERARVVMNARSRPLSGTYDGTLDLDGGGRLDGDLNATSPSARALAQWLGKPLPPNEGFGPLSVAGRLKTTEGLVTLDGATISLDGNRATGSIAATTGGTRPHVKADLRITELNLNPYLNGTSTAAGPRSSPAASQTVTPAANQGSGDAPPRTGEPRSIEDLLRDTTGPRVKGYTARTGWSDEPFDTSLLTLVDTDAKLAVGKLLVREVTIGQSDVVLALKGGTGKATFERVSLYEGNGRGVVNIEAAGPTPKLGANLVIENVAAAPLLHDAAAIDWLSGTGRVTIAVTAAGITQRQLVGSLSGRVETLFTHGAIKGFNVAKTLRGLGQGKLTGLSATDSEKTDFSELSATFNIADGIATNQDLKLASPLLRVSGSGQIMMPDRQVDYVVRPKVVSDLSGQGGNFDLSGLEVPINITGAWEDPKYAADLSKVDVGQATKAVEQIGKSLKGKSAGEIVDDLFGKDSKQGQQAKKLLEKFF